MVPKQSSHTQRCSVDFVLLHTLGTVDGTKTEQSYTEL